ncbi:unnamed protein product [Ambrosiozyma monospora]|uniref:Unnamed protein product n=1 Tax=Ambrosiozyma monospora TaxID=43982 RepID=A0A9W7DDG5_AMBMO|nr:unnamed protein product [Ambrosiozyma monospora]
MQSQLTNRYDQLQQQQQLQHAGEQRERERERQRHPSQKPLIGINAQTFASMFHCEGETEFFDMVNNLTSSKEIDSQYPFTWYPQYDTDARFDSSGRILYGGAYLYANPLSTPARLHLLGGGPNGSSIVVPLMKDNHFDLIEDVLTTEAKLKHVSKKKLLKQGMTLQQVDFEFINELNTDKQYIFENYDELKIDDAHIIKPDPMYESLSTIELSSDEFIWSQDLELNKLQSSNYSNNVDSYDAKLLKSMQFHLDSLGPENPHEHVPHLHEAKMNGTPLGDHYDWRFYNGLDQSDSSYASTANDVVTNGVFTNQHRRKAVIHRMARAWLRFCYESGITSFMAYGSMLGWVKNGLSLPWDEDIDVIVTMKGLNQLAKFHNSSLIVDLSGVESGVDGVDSGVGAYLIDIGVSFYDRVRGNGANVIDGRFIDVATGIYTDITALAWTDHYLELDSEMEQVVDRLVCTDANGECHKDVVIGQQITEPVFDENDELSKPGEITTHIKKVKWDQDDILGVAQILQSQQRLIHCRNDNIYRLDEISTMVPTFFEGVRTLVPLQFKSMLNRKYPGAIDRVKEYTNYSFFKDVRLWIKNAVCELDDYDAELYKDKTPNDAKYHETRFKNGKSCINAGGAGAGGGGGGAGGGADDVALEFESTREYTERHNSELFTDEESLLKLKLNQDEEFGVLRHDLFIVEYAEKLGIQLQ